MEMKLVMARLYATLWASVAKNVVYLTLIKRLALFTSPIAFSNMLISLFDYLDTYATRSNGRVRTTGSVL